MKCADIAVLGALSVATTPSAGTTNPQIEASADLRGPTPNNIFTVCQAATDALQITGFNTLIDITDDIWEGIIETNFNSCLTNAPNPPPALLPQDPLQPLQENSLTTNVKPEAEISTFSPPSVPATGDSSAALEKIVELKQQWLELLP